MSSEIKVDTISENTSGNGVAIDGLTIKDGGITATTGATVFNEGSADIDFRIESNDKTNMFFVDAGNNKIGINTTGSTPSQVTIEDVTGNGGGTLGLTTDTSGTSDNLGRLHFGNATDGSLAAIFGIADGASDAGTLTFRTEASGGALEERARITSTGQLLLASSTDYASSKLQVNHPSGFGASTNIAHFRNEESSGTVFGITVQFRNQAPDNQTSILQSWQDSSAIRARCFADGDFQNHDNAYGSLSDERIKQDIRDSNSQWDDIKALKVRNFKKKDDVRQYGDEAWEQIGVIAQELEDVGMDKLVRHSDPTEADIASDPAFGTLYTSDDAETQDAVLYTADDEEVIAGNQNVGDIKTPSTKQIGDIKEIKEQVKGVNYSILYMKAIKALQEAMTRIETLEAEVTALKGE